MATMYSISNNATDLSTQILEDYRLIQFHEDQCTTLCQRTYVDETTATYGELQDCLDGKSEVPKPSTTTTEKPTATTEASAET